METIINGKKLCVYDFILAETIDPEFKFELDGRGLRILIGDEKGGKLVDTSQVLNFDYKTGNFETLNTFYIKQSKEVIAE